MNKSWLGPAVTGLIVLGVVGVLLLNLEPGKVAKPDPPKVAPPDTKADPQGPAPLMAAIPERPIGEEVVKNHVRVNAVHASGVSMDGMSGPPSGSDLIHLEADVKATEDNPNGFAKDEFVPYLKINYSIVPASGGSAVDKGELFPMVASDGLHYGANIVRPRPGDYRLIYDIQPPSVNGLGRHVGAVGGVAGWWGPFQASFEWTVEPPVPPTAVAGSN